MKNIPLLSVLIPSIPERIPQAVALLDKLEQQRAPESLPVEVLLFTDNKLRPVGLKRQALLDIARGEYVAFVDDDDDVAPNYLSALVEGCLRQKDVVTFIQSATVNGVEGFIEFSLKHRTDAPWVAGQTAPRRPWHVCAWRAEIARQGVFTAINYGEDRDWVDQVAPLAKSESHIPEVLQYYRYSDGTTAAPAPR